MATTGTEPEPGALPDAPAAGQPAGDDATSTGPMRLVTTTVNTPRQAVGRHAAPEDAAERGALTIDDVVVEKVAVAATGEVEHVGGAVRRVLGVPTGREDGDGAPRVSAKVSGEVVALEVRLSVSYPASVRGVTGAVRAHVRDRVHALTDLTVSRVDISVASLTGTTSAGTKRVVA